MLICCLLVGGLTSGCKPNQNNKKITYSASKRKIIKCGGVMTLKNVRVYNYYNGKQKTLSGQAKIDGGWSNNSTEVIFTHNGDTYVVKCKISDKEVKIYYKDGNFYDTYKK